MKKVLMLGGSKQQIPAIKKAKEMGYYVITCDYLEDNPGHKFANEFYNVSTTDKETVLKLAKDLKIDGVVCYASDPAAPTAAYVSEKLGFPSNPYESVEILSNKELFRKFLKENGFNTPKAMGFSNYDEAISEIKKFKMPVIVKPVDSSGSKGVNKLDDVNNLKKCIEEALKYSRCKRFIIEEYIEKKGYQIAGDGFSYNGKLVFYTFMNDHFDNKAHNPYVPVAASCPSVLEDEIQDKIKLEIEKVFKLLNIKTGAYNFDIRLDKNDNIYLMEIGARNGGNYIPQVIEYATGVDLVTYTIKAAMGEDCSDLKQKQATDFYAYYAIHSNQSGIMKEIFIDDLVKKNNLLDLYLNYNIGDEIEAYQGSNNTIGIAILKFKNKEEMLDMINNMNNFIKVII